VTAMTLERNAFETWVQTTVGWKACKARNKPMHLRQNADGSYNDFRVNDRWLAWQARSKLDDHLTQHAELIGRLRELLETMSDVHGGDHHDNECPICTAIAPITAMLDAQPASDPVQPIDVAAVREVIENLHTRCSEVVSYRTQQEWADKLEAAIGGAKS
jgi:hypothetical protein